MAEGFKLTGLAKPPLYAGESSRRDDADYFRRSLDGTLVEACSDVSGLSSRGA